VAVGRTMLRTEAANPKCADVCKHPERVLHRRRMTPIYPRLEDLDTQAAADCLAVTRNTVKIRLHRARQALHALIERDLVRQTSPGRAIRP